MCEIHNSVLASIETQAENDFLKTHLEAQRHSKESCPNNNSCALARLLM